MTAGHAMTADDSSQGRRTGRTSPGAGGDPLATTSSQDWRAGWTRPDPGGSRTRAAVTVPVCPAPTWEAARGQADPEDLQRTVFAFLLAVNSGCAVVHTADGGRGPDGPRGQADVLTLGIEGERSLHALAESWTRTPARRHPDDPLDLMRRTLRICELPEFAFRVDRHTGVPPAAGHPLSCLVWVGDDGVEWTLTARRDIADEGVLRAFAGQAAAVIRALADHPGASAEATAGRVPQLFFDIRLLAAAGFTEVAAALHAWGAAIDLPVRVRRIEPEETRAPERETGRLRPASRGANLVVAGPGVGWSPVVGGHDAGGPAGTLPDGRPVAEMNANETRELYDEIVVRRRYLRHGLRVCDGDHVVDVGANIGLFTLFAAAEAENVRVTAFEPVSAVAEALRSNIDRYRVNATVSAVALGETRGERTITFYPHSSLQSGFHTDADADEEIIKGYARHRTAADGRITPDMREDVERALATTVRTRTTGRRLHRVPVIRLSDWIRDRRVERIHLLKIDAERAEEEVLAGIADEHWHLIDQIVAEVHDVGGRLARIGATLDRHGFDTVVEQDALFTGSEIFMLYAWRRGVPRRDASWLARQADAAAHWARVSSLPLYVTVPPGTTPSDERQVRDAAAARGLSFVGPRPAAGHPGPATGRPSPAQAGHATATAPTVSAATASVPTSAPTASAALELAEALLRTMTAVERPVTKAVLVDADNTLWGGVCGEIGPENVDVGGPYRRVQEFLLAQARSGRALCLCSRNNPEDVAAVFAAHPGMPLTLGDFTLVRADWGPKSATVSAVAAELGFAAESLVFIDDSPAERTEVALAHPALTVVDLPDDPHAFPEALHATWQLDIPPGTAEDRSRLRSFAHEARRREAAAAASTVADYLAQLELDVQVTDAEDGEADRISQLAARTTQFNLLLRRHTPGSVRQLIARGAVALSVRARDRFGDYGLVGFVSADPDPDGDGDGDTLRVRDFFLSCRALGRNVEWRMLRALAERATATGLRGIDLHAVPGPRNRPALDFVRAAHTLLAARPGGAAGPVDASAASRLDWRRVQQAAPGTAPAPAPPGAPDTMSPRPRWPVSPHAARVAEAAHAGPVSRPGPANTPYVAAETDTERRITEVWEDVLGVRPIGVHDDLFSLGCDSVTAALISTRLHRDHGMDVPADRLLGTPTVRGVAHLAAAGRRPAARRGEPAGTGDGSRAASYGQRRIWAAEMIGGRGNAQIIPLVHRVRGPLDLDRLRGALAAVVARHPALATVLTARDGVLVQRPCPQEFRLPVTDLTAVPARQRDREIERACTEFLSRAFDLERDLMLRAAVLVLGPADHVLLMALHHSAADGWSVDLVQRDLTSAYADPGPPAPPGPPFSDYSDHVLRRRRRQEFDEAVTAVLASLPGAGTARWDARGGGPVDPRHIRFPLGEPLIRRVRTLAQGLPATPFTVYLAAYQLLLAATTGTDTVVTGVPVANRADPAFSGTVGFVANLVPVPARVDWSAGIADHLTAAAHETAGALEHAEVPYGLVARRAPAPLFDTMFTLQPPPVHPLSLPGCAVTRAEPAVWPLPYPLMLDVWEHADGGTGLLRFDASADTPVPAGWVAEAYPLVLEAFCALPELALHRLRALLLPQVSEARDLVRQRLRAMRGGGR
ncbi:FkbH-like protein/FkbM family methyltransferase [Streptosporangium becharense]|uniref:FkbH-like protein/FkbM family methyltransferase n=1 Tax=Streptosporangium becharense TaxID=1816182 RepID=A0A7W9IBU6_9ACTN|nr:FkbM family methyltransferase [Streptosporangium becharense]MBB2910618.1 FkbH-like protein/FkbM family methyltransferase [Streptosporangium becharense]MBB5817314.1 FkbH-like protein/FkbM family methyltransferase [Streptosporangium becharense]